MSGLVKTVDCGKNVLAGFGIAAAEPASRLPHEAVLDRRNLEMRSKSRRLAVSGILVLVGAFLMASPGTGCTPFLAKSALTATDFCFIFDCQNGIFAGTIDPCSPTGPLGSPNGPLFVDCP